MPPNFYDILGIQKDFQSKDLRASFRSFSLKYHPDKVAAEVCISKLYYFGSAP